MAYLVTVSSKSGGGKSEVYEYLHRMHGDLFPMPTYTSREPREDDEGGYIFKDKNYFHENKEEFLELSTYPPHSDPQEDHVHYYGKHKSQFDGKNYILSMDEVGVLSLKELEEQDALGEYHVVTIFVDVDEAIRLDRINHDTERIARDVKRKYLPLEYFDYVFDNSGTTEELYAQVDAMIKELKEK